MLKSLNREIEDARQFVEGLAKKIDPAIRVKADGQDSVCEDAFELVLQKGPKVRRIRVTAVEVMNARTEPRDIEELLRSAWQSKHEYASDLR